MKKLLSAFFVSITMCVCAQTNSTFGLNDTAFHVGQTYSFPSCITIDNRDFCEEIKPQIDSLASFMIAHPELIFEIASHTDSRGGDSSNLHLSENRATFLKNGLISRGVPANNLAAVGYGESKPVISQRRIDAEQDKSTKEKLHTQNRRYEITIIYRFKDVFTLADSVFTAGSVFRCAILFDFDKATLRPESVVLIDSIAKFLIAHPELSVEVTNHRDTRGNDHYGSNLTAARARSVEDRLVQQGVPRERVRSKGFGEIQPLIAESHISKLLSKKGREEMHQLNRRTEITITEIK